MKQNDNVTSNGSMADDENMETDFGEIMVGNLPENDENMNSSCCLSITNVPTVVFDDGEIKEEFEQLFQAFDEDVSISYLKSFRRVRVAFPASQPATETKLVLHGCKYRGAELGVYYVQSCQSIRSNSTPSQLKPPPLTKQFLISPPASPPVGWEPIHEGSPVINYDLLAAVAKLDTSQPYQLHPPHTDSPSIVVHLCDEDDDSTEKTEEERFHPLTNLPREVVQTRRPNVDS